jgi:hypothetical protein
VLTWIEMGGSAIVAFLYVAILTSAVTSRSRRKKAPPPQEGTAGTTNPVRPYVA